MFEGPKKIIYVARSKLVACEVLDVATKKFGKNFEVGWEMATLDLAFSEIIKKFGPKNYRVLLSDDLAYVARFVVPSSVAKAQVREHVLSQLQEKVPDDIDEGEWDYREIRSKAGEGRDVLAFALVKSFARALADATAKSGLGVDAIEPETISKTRDANAYIGIALKTDIRGKDEDVLNLTPTAVNTNIQTPQTPASANQGATSMPQTQSSASLQAPRRLWLKVLVILAPLVIVGILVGGFLYLRSNIEPASPTPTPQEAAKGEEQNEPTASPSVEGISEASELDIPGLKVQVLNGSGIAGEADNVSDLLFDEGFAGIETGNADSFDFIDTQIQVKESADFAYSFIETALNGKYTLARVEEYLKDDSDYDIVITVGQAL